jgi:hypothetical protein
MMKIMRKEIFLAVSLFFMSLSVASAQEFGKKELGNWTLKVGFDERFRYEYRHDFDFKSTAKDSGSLLFNRFMVNTKANLKDSWGQNILELFVEGLDARVGAYQTKAPNQKDSFDLHQAYVKFYNILASDFDFKVGRQEMKYGAGRLIANPTWNNRIRHFDAAVVHYHPSDLYFDILIADDVKYDDNNFNGIQYKEKLMGLYGGYQGGKFIPRTEFYFLPQIINNIFTKSTRYTGGARLQGELPGKVLYDFEFPYQFGKANHKEIKAYAFHVDLSREFQGVFLEPKAIFEYNQASGDTDPRDHVNGTFIPLYQSTHEPYGIMDFFRWQNMRDIELKLNLVITKKLRIVPETDFFWLMSTNDAWYDSSGAVIRNVRKGRRSHYVGQEASLRGYYEVNKNIKLESGYAHFFTGDYVKDTGANDDADWFYAQFSLKY